MNLQQSYNILLLWFYTDPLFQYNMDGQLFRTSYAQRFHDVLDAHGHDHDMDQSDDFRPSHQICCPESSYQSLFCEDTYQYQFFFYKLATW